MTYDVLVVGGGPAGASTAFQLARRGVRVVVVERARFPRSKPCAECLSPQAAEILDDMDVLTALSARGAWLKGMVVRAPNGLEARGDYVAAHGFRGYRDGGLSVRREILDQVLLERARAAGTHLVEGARVTDLLHDAQGRVNGVAGLARDGTALRLTARIVVGADGLRSVVSRRLGLARRRPWPDRISIVAHYAGVRGITNYGEMHVEPDGFVGVADVGGDVTTVAAVFPRRVARAMSGDPGAFLTRWLESKAQLAPRFAQAERVGVTAAVGPFASHARRASHAGALLVGDAADFFDPFTGEGIYAALRGGAFAADAARDALLDASRERDVFVNYDRLRARTFGGKWMVERIIGACVGSPALVNRAARALANDKRLADLLVGVTGDFVPPSQVLRLGYLARLFVLPTFSMPT